MRATSKSPTSRRLMVYLCGVSIGLLLLGAFNARRTREAHARLAEEAQQAAQQAATVGEQGSAPTGTPVEPQ